MKYALPVVTLSLFLITGHGFGQESAPHNELNYIYELIKDGEIEELREACRERGLETRGDLLTLKRRLLDYEMKLQLKPFEARVSGEIEDEIVLNNADFIRYREDENGDELIFLSGNVNITYGELRINADEVEINNDRGLVTGRGDILFVDGEKTYVGESFFYNTQTDEGYFYNAKTSIGHFIYKGSTIRKINDDEKYSADNVTLMTSDIKYPHSRVEAEKLFFYDSERALVKKASLYYGHDDVVRLPYYYRNVKDRKLQSSLHFRERSGLALQNTYTHLKTDEKELVLKGDFYERLGFYMGVDYGNLYEKGETRIDLSAALSNDVYYYEGVTENWSPLGPPGSNSPAINRNVRYKTSAYQKLRVVRGYSNTTELSFFWLADPYYEYDFERRKQGFDVFDFIGQAESDFPRKGSGYSWDLNNYFQYENLNVTLKNRIHFEPQRNTGVDTVSLPDYYEYRLYKVTAPYVGIFHSMYILSDTASPIISDLLYSSTATYSHIIYYSELGRPSSELHSAGGAVSLTKDYYLGDLVRFTPEITGGAEGQYHVDADSTELWDDRRNSLVYGRTAEETQVGTSKAYVALGHDLKYKLVGPDDLYEHHRFRIHNLSAWGYLEFWRMTEKIQTSYDLRPTYDWTTGQYEPYSFDKSHFDPLKNTITFTPVQQITLSDILIYDIALSQMKTNQVNLSYASDEIDIRNHMVLLTWDLEWRHNFINPIIDTFSSLVGLDADIYRFWTAYFRVLSRNDSLWRYFPGTARELGIQPINPLTDLLRSFNFFSRDDRKASHFKMKSISFGFIRDLYDWEMKFDYTGNRELSYDGSRYIWDNTYSISIGLKEVRDVTFHTRFSEER